MHRREPGQRRRIGGVRRDRLLEEGLRLVERPLLEPMEEAPASLVALEDVHARRRAGGRRRVPRPERLRGRRREAVLHREHPVDLAVDFLGRRRSAPVTPSVSCDGHAQPLADALVGARTAPIGSRGRGRDRAVSPARSRQGRAAHLARAARAETPGRPREVRARGSRRNRCRSSRRRLFPERLRNATIASVSGSEASSSPEPEARAGPPETRPPRRTAAPGRAPSRGRAQRRRPPERAVAASGSTSAGEDRRDALGRRSSRERPARPATIS